MSTAYTPLTDEQIKLLAVTHARFTSDAAIDDFDEDASFVDLVAEMLPALLAEVADLRAMRARLEVLASTPNHVGVHPQRIRTALNGGQS